MADGDNEVNISAVEVQQQYYEAIGDADWERYEKKDRHLLLQKIAMALCGPPTEEGNLADHYDCDQPPQLQGYDLRCVEIAMKVFKKVCEQAKHSHNGENIYISIIRVVCVAPAKEVGRFKRKPADYWLNLHEKRGREIVMSIFHVFSIRKCISPRSGAKGCRVFIDHDARVYKDWKSYLKENKLPKAVMIVPTNGEYQGEIKNDIATVMLDVVPSPALGIGARVLGIADTANTVVGVGAIVGAVGLITAPVVAPAAVTAMGVAAGATAVYGIVRSSIHLADRGQHEQSISLKDFESRGSWINIFMSTAGLSFTAAGKLLTWAATTGTSVRILLNAVQFLKYTTIAGGLLGLVNSFGEMIHKYKKYKEKPTKLELFQFTSSLLFFGIGVMSNKVAQEIVEDAQTKTISDIRESLTSKAKRKLFDKVVAETRRLHGNLIKGNTEIIKGLRVITDKNQFFSKLSKMNKQMRISLSSDGAATFNNQVKMTVSQLTELGKVGRDKLFETLGPADKTTNNPQCSRTNLIVTPSTSQIVAERVTEFFYIRPEEALKIAKFLYDLSKSDKEYICEMLSDISSKVHQVLLLLCADLLGALLPLDDSCLGPDWKIRMMEFVIDHLGSIYSSHNCEDDECGLKCVFKQFMFQGRIDPKSIEMLKDKVVKHLSEAKTKKADPIDLKKYDGVHGVGVNLQERYIKLQAGKLINVGGHDIIIKEVTVEKLQKLFFSYSQEKCDLFLDVCTRVIKVMTEEEVQCMNLINPDEDVLLRIADYIHSCYMLKKLYTMSKYNGSIDIDTIFLLKRDVIEWSKVQQRSKPEKCPICKGTKYTQ